MKTCLMSLLFGFGIPVAFVLIGLLVTLIVQIAAKLFGINGGFIVAFILILGIVLSFLFYTASKEYE